MSIRNDRITEQVRQEITLILRDDLTDPRIGELTLTRVILSKDLSAAQVYWSPFETDDAVIEETEAGLVSAAGFVRKLLAGRLDLRRTPAIDFRCDRSVGAGDRALAVLRELDISPAEPEEVSPGEEASPGEEPSPGEAAAENETQSSTDANGESDDGQPT